MTVEADETVRRVIDLVRDAGLHEHAERIVREVTTRRPRDLLVLAMGGAGAGTSSVVAALLGRPDWFSRSPTPTRGYLVVRWGQPTARAWCDDGADAVDVDLAAVPDVLAGTHPAVGMSVRAVEATLPSPLLAGGVTVVDVPGVGSAVPGRDRDTAALLARADAVVHVTSAAGPLDREELASLRAAAARVASLVVVVNRIDQFPGWRKVVDDDHRLLRDQLGDRSVPVLPMSAALAHEATHRRTEMPRLADDLEVESGLPGLAGTLSVDVVAHRDRLRERNLRIVCLNALEELRELTRACTQVDGTSGAATAQSRERLLALRDGAASAGARVDEVFAGLHVAVQRCLLDGLRAAAAHAEEELASPRADGDEVLRALVADLRRQDREVERLVGTAVGDLVVEVAELLGTPLDVRSVAPVASLAGEVDLAAVASGSAPPRTRSGTCMTLASMLVSSSTSVGLLSQRMTTVGLDPIALLIGTGVALSAARLGASMRQSRRHDRSSSARARVRAALDHVRATEPDGLRARVDRVRTDVEAAVRQAVEARNEQLLEQHRQVEAIAAASQADRTAAAVDARGRLAEIDLLAGRLATLGEPT